MHCATHRAGSFRRLTAAFLTVAVAGCWPATLVHSSESRATESRAASNAGFGGVVFGSDGLTALKGASVKAAHLPSGQIFVSGPTGADGRYAMKGLPAGEYDLAVETSTGLYAAGATLNAVDGRQLTVSFALTADPQEGQPKSDAKPDEKPKEETPKEEKPADTQEPAAKKKSKRTGSFWRTSGGAAILIVGGGVAAAALAGAATNGDDDEEDNSMSPGGN